MQYPKVPNHYQEQADESVFSANDLVILEKLDGQNFRAFIFDEEYSEHYPENVHKWNPTHKDILIGTKTTIRGIVGETDLYGDFKRVSQYLQENLNIEQVLSVHEKYNSPIILFGEHMIKHSIDYDYESDPPPAFLGFDILVLTEQPEDIPSNPYRKFVGFLDFNEAQRVFNSIGLQTVPVIDRGEKINPNEYTVPKSEYTDKTAEGVIIRSDKLQERIKIVTEEFAERNKQIWGMHEGQADSGEELFIAKYIPHQRVRKHVHAAKYNNQDLDPESLAESILFDVWEEEIDDIKYADYSLTPAKLFEVVEPYCNEVKELLETNASLNDVDISELQLHEDLPEDSHPHYTEKDIPPYISQKIDEAGTVEKGLIAAMLSEEDIHNCIDEHDEITRSLIQPVWDEMVDKFWYDNWSIISRLPYEFTPRNCSEEIRDRVISIIDNREETDVPGEPNTWEP